MQRVAEHKADKAEADIEGIKREIRDLQKALGELVDALIIEEKPGPKEIKKLQAFKKKAIAESSKEKLPKKKRQKSGIKSQKDSWVLTGSHAKVLMTLV